MKKTGRRLERMVAILIFIVSLMACQEDLVMSDINKKVSEPDTTSLLRAKTDSVQIISNNTDSSKLDQQIYTTTSTLETANYYVSPTGSDSNPGTITKPFKTWQKAIDVAVAGNLIYLRGGTYTTDATKLDAISIKKSGSAGKLIRVWAYPNEIPILKCGGSNLSGIRLEGNYWHFKGFEITNLKQTQGKISKTFVSVNSSNNIYELLNIHHNGGPGFLINNNSGGNLVLNCDFHDNYDPYDNGGNADGMSIGFIPKGLANRIKGCRFWNNSDDGVDLWKNEGTVYIDSCWAWHNGFIPGTETGVGNGNGYKFGRTDLVPETRPQRIVRNCKSFLNRNNGFDQNNGNIIMEMRHNVAYKNGRYGFFFYSLPLAHILEDNVAIDNYSTSKLSSQYVVNTQCVQTYNSWQKSITSSSIFISIDPKGVDGPRNANGSLPYVSFLKLK
jgi:hypothetical protein